MDTSIQVLHNASFMYRHSILGWYGQPCHEQNSEDYWHHVHWTCTVDTSNNTDEDRLRIIYLVTKMPVYIIRKVHTWLLFIIQLTLCTIEIQFVLYSLQVHCIGLMITASHETFSGQIKHLPDQIKYGQTKFLYIINGQLIEFAKEKECPDNFHSLP